MIKTKIKNNKAAEVPQGEYIRLKKIEKDFGYFLSFAEHTRDIKKSRQEAKRGKIISQSKLFSKLGI